MSEVGYASLFVLSFLAATILPFSSEAVLSAMLVGDFNVVATVVVATIGNWLGSLTCFYLGYLGKLEWIEKWLKIKPESIEKFRHRTQRYGAWFGLLVWVPGVGDVIAVCLGFVRSPALKTAVAILIGKAFRYIAVAYATLFIIEKTV